MNQGLALNPKSRSIQEICESSSVTSVTIWYSALIAEREGDVLKLKKHYTYKQGTEDVGNTHRRRVWRHVGKAHTHCFHNNSAYMQTAVLFVLEATNENCTMHFLISSISISLLSLIIKKNCFAIYRKKEIKLLVSRNLFGSVEFRSYCTGLWGKPKLLTFLIPLKVHKQACETTYSCVLICIHVCLRMSMYVFFLCVNVWTCVHVLRICVCVCVCLSVCAFVYDQHHQKFSIFDHRKFTQTSILNNSWNNTLLLSKLFKKAKSQKQKTPLS